MAQYPRGFLYCTEAVAPPKGWAGSALFPGLSYDAGWHHSAARSPVARVEVIGHCVPVDRPVAAAYSPAADLLAHLEASEAAFLARLSAACGRYVVLYARKDGSVRLVADATGLRTVCHSTGPAPVAGSHPRLVNASLSAPADSVLPPEKWGLPGRMTVFEPVKMLPPNQVLDLTTGDLTRFYPRHAPTPRTAREAAPEVLAMTRTATANFHRRYGGLRLALTAGLDSRCNLAIARAAGIPIDAFTYFHTEEAHIDCRLAQEICRRCGIAHRILDLSEDGGHRHRHMLGQIMEDEGGWPTMLSSHLLEIGQAFYFGRGLPVPDTPEEGARLYVKLARRDKWDEVEAYGRARYKALAAAAFGDFYRATGFEAATAHIHPFDLFYWEHRMAAWQAQNVLTRDPGCDTFNPFNARDILETLLSVPLADREACTVFREVLDTAAPDLLELPVNPREMPAL